MTPLEITDADREDASSFYTTEIDRNGFYSDTSMQRAYLSGCRRGKTQGALEVIKMLESDEFEKFDHSDHLASQSRLVARKAYAQMLRDKLGIK